MLASIKAILTFLPEIIQFIKSVIGLVDKGVEKSIIKARLKKIDKAFKEEDRPKAARLLNETFERNKHH